MMFAIFLDKRQKRVFDFVKEDGKRLTQVMSTETFRKLSMAQVCEMLALFGEADVGGHE